MARKKGDLSRYVERITTEQFPVGEPDLSQIKKAEKENSWHMLLCPDCVYRISNSKFKGKRKYLPRSMTSFESNPGGKELLIWSMKREILKLKEEDEKKNRTSHYITWKNRAAEFFGVSKKTIENWVKEFNIQTQKERYAALRPEATAALKKMRKSG